MEKTAEQRHRELVAATILAGMLANPNLARDRVHLYEQSATLTGQAEAMAALLCGDANHE